MSLLQKDLEAKIIDNISASLANDATVADKFRLTGSWQPVAAGLVRWIEDDADKPSIVSVAVGSPGRDTYSNPTLSFALTVSLFLKYEQDPTGDLLLALADAVQRTLDAWQAETYQSAFTRFDLPNRLSVDDISINPGASPAVSNGRVAVAWTATLSGSLIS